MLTSNATIAKYLARYALWPLSQADRPKDREPDVRADGAGPVTGRSTFHAASAPVPERWDRVMVIPCYRESPAFLKLLPGAASADGAPLADADANAASAHAPSVLVICVLNRPESDSDPEANTALREALLAHCVGFMTVNTPSPVLAAVSSGSVQTLPLCRVGGSDIALLDLERLEGVTPAQQGVGRARRMGCDLALWLIDRGRVRRPWIFSSDADAKWPSAWLNEAWPDTAAAVVLPYRHACHESQQNGPLTEATHIYEQWLEAYVQGLARAGSPYAFHTLGSSCAFHAESYAAVRGMPLRAGAEDFYLLNKLAKVGPVLCPKGPPIVIQARASDRVPFGTGPAVKRLMAEGDPTVVPLFYPPACYDALAALLAEVPRWLAGDEGHEVPLEFTAAPGSIPLTARLQAESLRLLASMGVGEALRHARQHGATPTARLRQWHIWFDGFRTLKFVRGLRECLGGDISYRTFIETGH